MIDRCSSLSAMSRRGFMRHAEGAAAGTTLTGLSSVFASSQGPRRNREVVREFPYGTVRLTHGPIKQHFDRIHAHYLALDNDRLLKVFRQHAGLPAPGPDMGGWYDTDGFVPGLTLGQYISGLARLGAATGDRAAHDKVDPLADGIDVLPEKHAYSHIIALSSGAQAYLNLGDGKYLRALTNTWRFLERQRFASGGWAPEEQFVALGRGMLAESLKNSKAHFETPCGSYADMKLARYLIRLTGRPEYGDGLEHTLYNTMLATRVPNSDGDYPYYSNYGANAEKRYYQRKWPCCSGTLAQGVADYVLNTYFHDDDALLVNLFVASEVVWKRAGGVVAIVQDTDYPNTDAVRLTVREAGNGRFALKLRIPAWADGATLQVNGKTEDVAPGELATVSGRWKAGDTIAMVVPQPLRTLPIDAENPNLAALMRGAVMYVGLNPWEGIGEQSVNLPGSLSPLSSSGQAYRTVIAGRDLVFVPYFTIDTERYNTYFRIP